MIKKESINEISHLVLREVQTPLVASLIKEFSKNPGIKNMGTLLTCNSDFAFLDDFNFEIKLVRTKTIMEDNDICNFCYKME